MKTLGYLIYKEGEGLMAFRRTEQEAKEYSTFCEEVDPNSVFTIKHWTQDIGS